MDDYTRFDNLDPDSSFDLRPFKDLARRAKELGFELFYCDSPEEMAIDMMITPITNRAAAGLIAASGDPLCVSYAAHTVYRPDEHPLIVALDDTGPFIIEKAREFVAE